jgi:hypothetical protein
MVRSRIDKIRESQLADIPEPLEHGRVKQRESIILNLDIPMDGIFDNFHKTTKRISYTWDKSIE